MKAPAVAKLIPAALAVGGAGLLWSWLGCAASGGLDMLGQRDDDGMQTAATQGRPASQGAPAGRLTKGDGAPADLPGAWPQFRGANLDGISPEKVALAAQWPAQGPKPLWSVDLGEGHAGPAVLGGRVYLLDYDRDKQADCLRCLSLADGREIWRYAYPVPVKRNHGMSRTVPAVTDRYVVAMGPKCHVTCLDAVSGERVWSMDLVGQYGTKVPPWYAGQCPLIDQERVVLAPGGTDVLMLAVELATGKVVWQTPNPRAWQMTHASIAPMTFAGKRMYVYCGSGGVVGVSADDGQVLWETTDWKINIATVPTPAVIGEGKIFFAGGYEAGCLMGQLEETGGKLALARLWRLKSDVFGATQHTPILYEGKLYGVRPDGELVCLGLDGQVVWTSGRAHVFGLGAFLLADGKLLLVNDTGVLTLAQATPEGYRQLAQAKVLDGHDSWGPLALAGGRLLARDLTRMVCLDLRAGP